MPRKLVVFPIPVSTKFNIILISSVYLNLAINLTSSSCLVLNTASHSLSGVKFNSFPRISPYNNDVVFSNFAIINLLPISFD